MKRITTLLFAASIAVLSLFSCTKEEPEVKVTSIAVSPASLSMETGSTQTVTVSVMPENAANKTYKSYSSDSNVAAIDDRGVVTAVADGTARLVFEAQDGSGVKGECEVTVSSKSATPDYTFVMIGCGGGDLDSSIMKELIENFQYLPSSVRMVGIWKPSKFESNGETALQANLPADMQGTRYFELELKDGADREKLYADFDALDKKGDSATGLEWNKLFLGNFVNERFAGKDADFALNSPADIAVAIQYAVAKQPAKKYILITNNHGGGWKLTDDQALTKAQVFDDNIGDYGISLDELNEGVKKSGVKFDLLFCDLCLMAQLENLVGFADNFPICIASAELTSYSYFGMLAKRLVGYGDKTIDDLLVQCKDWVSDEKDGYKCNWEKYSSVDPSKDMDCQDMGVYDLRKISQLTAVIKNIAAWYTASYDAKNPDLKRVINAAVAGSLYATPSSTSGRESIKYYSFQYDLYQKLAYTEEMGTSRMALIDTLCFGKEAGFWETAKKNKAVDLILERVRSNEDNPPVKPTINEVMTYGLCLAHFVKTTVDFAKDMELDTEAAALDALYTQYISTLKSISYIKCSHDDCSWMDPYLYTSPTVTVYSLNAKGFVPVFNDDQGNWSLHDALNSFARGGEDDVVAGDLHTFYSGPLLSKEKFSLDAAKASIKNTRFDKETGWSAFLEKLEVNPSIFTNPVRASLLYESK